ncbi:MAG TPA: hypothetical protein VGF59_31045 [Bryobacteraceae bacterium]|jgi:hypothetical protein
MRKTLSLIAMTIVGMGALAAPAVAKDRNDYTYGNSRYVTTYNTHNRAEKARLEKLARLRRERERARWNHDHFGWR